MDVASARQQLQNPGLAPEYLAAIAAEHPELWGEIAAHPSIYPELLAWIRTQTPAPRAQAAPQAQAMPQAQPQNREPQAQPVPQMQPGQSAPPGAKAKSKRTLAMVGGVVGALVAGAALGAAFYFFKGDSSELGTEKSVSAGLKQAAKLSGDDKEVIELQGVYGPGLFYYAEPEKGAEADGGLNQILITLDEGSDLKAAESAASELGAVIVGINQYTSTYQLRCPGESDATTFRSSLQKSGNIAGVASSTQNVSVAVKPVTGNASSKQAANVVGKPVIDFYNQEKGLGETVVGGLDGPSSGTDTSVTDTIELVPNAQPPDSAPTVFEPEASDAFSIGSQLTYLIEQSDKPSVLIVPGLYSPSADEQEAAVKIVGQQLLGLAERGSPQFLLVAPASTEQFDLWSGLQRAYPSELGDQILVVGSEVVVPGEAVAAEDSGSGLGLVAAAASAVWGVNPDLTAQQVKQILLLTGLDGTDQLEQEKASGDFEGSEDGFEETPGDGSLWGVVVDVPSAMQVAVSTKGQSSEATGATIASLEALPFPPALLGAWCPADQLDSDGEDCVNFTDLLAANPEATIEGGQGALTPESPTDGSLPIYTFKVCLTGDCSEGEALLFAYYPAGSVWECEANADAPGCKNAPAGDEGAPSQSGDVADEDESATEEGATKDSAIAPHEAGWPRIVQRYAVDGELMQSTPLMLNLQTEKNYDSLPLPVVRDVEPWPTSRGSEYKLASHWLGMDQGYEFLVARQGQVGAALYVQESAANSTLEGPYPALEDLGELTWVAESGVVNAEGQAYTWSPRFMGISGVDDFTDPVSLNDALGLEKPVAQFTRIVCNHCQIDLTDPLPQATAILYQDGSAELIHDSGKAEPFGPSSEIVSMDTDPSSNTVFVTADGKVFRAFFDDDPVPYDFSGANVTYACGAGPAIFAVTDTGELWVADGFQGQSPGELVDLPTPGTTVTEIACAPHSLSSSRVPYFESRALVLTDDTMLQQLTRPFGEDVPLAWHPLGGPGVLAVQGHLVWFEGERMQGVDTPDYDGIGVLVD